MPSATTWLDGHALPPDVASAVWRGTDMAGRAGAVVPSGHAGLDGELPGGGWPVRALTEILSPRPAVLEWRLLGPALCTVAATGGRVVVVGPPQPPHLPGLAAAGLDERHLVWVRAERAAERLWCVEQLLRANACGALVGWLPQARAQQVRRLQVGAQTFDGPVFLFRPASVRCEASAAPLRLSVRAGMDWTLQVEVFKRRGPAHDGVVSLPSIPGTLSAMLPSRLLQPGRSLTPREGVAHAVVGAAAAPRPRRHATAP